MPQKPEKYSPKQLTKFLRKVACEYASIEDGGDPITNAEKLARTIWDKANGHIEVQYKGGETTEKVHPPAVWAIQMIMERLEGKVPTAQDEANTKLSTAARVGELSVSLVNSVTADVLSGPKGPPPLRPQSEDSDNG